MNDSHFDLIVIGSGPGGQKAALQGAKAGKNVAIIENGSDVGGGCVEYGTLPSKSFRESVYRFSLGSQGVLGKETRRAPSPHKIPEMARLLERKERVVLEESRVIRDQLKRNSVRIFLGHAKFTSPHDLLVTGKDGKNKKIKGDVIVIAVGSSPVTSETLGLDGQLVLDSNSILTLKQVPKRMIVLGAGIIGCEYASMFSMAGTEVVLVDKRKQMLASVDREVVDHLMERYRYQGMEIHLGVEAVGVKKIHGTSSGAKKSGTKVGSSSGKGSAKGASVEIELSNGDFLSADCVLVAQGRIGNTKDLGLESAGVVADDRGLIKTSSSFQTNVPHIYAVGDVVGPPALASTSMEQGRIATCHAFKIPSSLIAGNHPGTSDSVAEMSTLYPYGIYTIPEISMIGRTEEELLESGVDFVAGKARYRELARGQIVGDYWGLLKLLVDRKTAKILGVHIVGDNAADLIHIGQAVMAFEGTVHYFIQSVFNYPTLAEAYKTAAFHAVNLMRGTTKSK
jgi:NAD(P) transhydrogenase